MLFYIAASILICLWSLVVTFILVKAALFYFQNRREIDNGIGFYNAILTRLQRAASNPPPNSRLLTPAPRQRSLPPPSTPIQPRRRRTFRRDQSLPPTLSPIIEVLLNTIKIDCMQLLIMKCFLHSLILMMMTMSLSHGVFQTFQSIPSTP